ncbi:MAG: hypothetical protein M3494_17330 [Actinomycetota bacterium]|jgi:hypothetical protein|nr:hypothetical protein [Actinomycetota bacterium]
MNITSIENAIDEVIKNKPQSSSRLSPVADFAIEQFDQHGLPGVKGGSGGELRIGGLARSKDWDVAYDFAGKPRLLLSLKSIWNNAGGSVPNRIDDLMGEASNVQQLSPEIVIGYIVLFDTKADSKRRTDDLNWSQFFEAAVKSVAIRRAPIWNQGLLEGTWFIRFDSRRSKGERILDPPKASDEGDAFFSALLRELKIREPAIPFSKDP